MNDTIIYTDGSCHTQLLIGAWAAIVFVGNRREVLSGVVHNTTHNRMELMAVIEAIKFVGPSVGQSVIRVFSDSQYVVGLQARKSKLQAAGFRTKAGNDTRNADLVKELWQLQELVNVEFVKVAAHLAKADKVNYNIEVDGLVRGLLRSAINERPDGDLGIG